MQISEELNFILLAAFNEASRRNHEYLTPEHILYATISTKAAQKLIVDLGGQVDRLKSNLEKYFSEHIKIIKNQEPVQSLAFQNVMSRAIWHTSSAQKKELSVGDVLVSIFDEQESFAAYYFQQEGISRYNLLTYISHSTEDHLAFQDDKPKTETKDQAKEEDDFLARFSIDLVKKAQEEKVDPLIGRDEVLERMIQVLARRNKNNPILVGNPGVGKTALAEGLALKVAQEKVPPFLKDSFIYSLDLGAILAGTKFRGDFEDRLKKIFQILDKKEKVIIHLDEIHNIVGAGATSGGSLDVSNLLKPILTAGQIKCIGSTTYEEYRKFFEKDRALARRFQKIEVPEPTEEETCKILFGLKSRYEDYHQVVYKEEALKRASFLSKKYLLDRYLPDKALDLIDEAGAQACLSRNNQDKVTTISSIEIEKVLSKIAKIPLETVSASEWQELKNLSALLPKRIFGQEEALKKVIEAIKRNRVGFGQEEKPVASLLLVGPTGVGKTELARQLALALGIKLHRFDMSEYQEKVTVSRFIGASPGYVGYEEGGLLVETIRKSPTSILLLDEIEKAHPDIFNTLLQVMDYATLTDSSGQKADFRNVILIMTSNAGAREMEKNPLGFEQISSANEGFTKAVEKLFSPEFRNRLDGVIPFKNLDQKIILKIVKKEIKNFKEQLKKKKVILKVTVASYQWLAEKSFSSKLGAREVFRLVEDKIKSFFVDEVLFGRLAQGGEAKVEVKDNDLKVYFLD